MAFQSYLESIQVYLVLTFSGEALICKRREGKERKAPSLEFWVTGDCPTPFPCISIRGFPDWGEPQGTARHPPPYPSGLRPALRSPAPRRCRRRLFLVVPGQVWHVTWPLPQNALGLAVLVCEHLRQLAESPSTHCPLPAESAASCWALTRQLPPAAPLTGNLIGPSDQPCVWGAPCTEHLQLALKVMSVSPEGEATAWPKGHAPKAA